MKLGLSTIGMDLSPVPLRELGRRAEALGYDSIWTSEAWGRDAFMPLAYLAASTTTIKLGTAIAQIFARTPAATAMTALTLQQLSDGRLLLGLGVSGPQVVEGWHGVPFRRPLAATRDSVAILRQALAAEVRVEHAGDTFAVPFRGEGATGLGKPLRMSMPGAPETPIFIAALGPRNTDLAVEIGDGLLPYMWSPLHWKNVWGDALARAKPGYRVAPTVFAAVGDDIAACRDTIRPRIALHVGGMGSREQNFYKTLVERYGRTDEAQRIQDLFLSGDRKGATAAVSDDLVDELSLVGPPAHIADQLAAWRACPLDTLIVEPTGDRAVEKIAELW